MRLAFAVRDLGHSQLSYRIITGMNSWVSHKNDGWVFFEDNCRPLLGCHFGVMNSEGMYGFGGFLIATSLSTLKKVSQCPRAVPYFYCWDLEWLRTRYLYSQIMPMYRSVPILARSEEHAKIIANCWNVSVYNVGENVQQIADTVQELHERSLSLHSGVG